MIVLYDLKMVLQNFQTTNKSKKSDHKINFQLTTFVHDRYLDVAREAGGCGGEQGGEGRIQRSECYTTTGV